MHFDTHQHFWRLANVFTDWPTPELTPIYRDFDPDDLAEELAKANVDGTILVQAAPSVDESRYCLAIADHCAFVKGVVGWIDFEAADALDQLDRLAESPWLKGLRPMVQSIAEPGWLLRTAFTPVFEAMIERGLSLDGLVTRQQIGDLDRLARRHPHLRIVLDHGGKPPIAGGDFGAWAQAIEELAVSSNVFCKLSGLWTEAGDDRSISAIRPYVDHMLATFGPERLMWGSDWPVLRLAGDYADWLGQCESMLDTLTDKQISAILGGNGRRFYGID